LPFVKSLIEFDPKISYFTGEELRLTVGPDEYMEKLVEYGIMKIFAICAVKETNQSWCEEDDFQVTKPKLNIAVSVVQSR